MNKKIERLNIGIDKKRVKAYELNLKNKQNLFNDAREYCTQFVKISSFKAFSDNMMEYFAECFKSEHGKDFSKLMTYEKCCEMSGIELHRIRAYQNAYDTIDIELNPLTLEPTAEADHCTYLNSEAEITKYLRGKFILDKMNEITAEGIDFNRNALQRMFPDTFSYDWELNELLPNSK